MPYLIVEEEVGVGLSGVGDIDTHGGTTQVCAPDRVYLQEATTGRIPLLDCQRSPRLVGTINILFIL